MRSSRVYLARTKLISVHSSASGVTSSQLRRATADWAAWYERPALAPRLAFRESLEFESRNRSTRCNHDPEIFDLSAGRFAGYWLCRRSEWAGPYRHDQKCCLPTRSAAD